MKKSTEELLKILKNSSLDTYLKNNNGEMIENPICDYLTAIIDERNLSKAEVIRNSYIQTNYAYQIFSGLKVPSRDKLISLCFGLSLSIDEAQTLLKYAGYAQL